MTRQQKIVLSMLRVAGKAGVYNYEFARNNILRYSARIDEMRAQGVEIRTVRISAGVFKYVLEEFLKEKPKSTWREEKKRELKKEIEERGQSSLF